ncbi:sodium-independent anion transporter [Algimonas ampicilliniresistens]|uniref:Sodium-independent anion transporter n=1 Tax=Algimonas ampicilliniresistens TaxID=1298735 RepID=A0ABQ5V736_9PROT|nr:SulP family inorganic anion transporter [Algimonas ampicilliniresistens]GLQ23356.1 sodium-independent anion transporter [Algimonas ampicilliniresistens]
MSGLIGSAVKAQWGWLTEYNKTLFSNDLVAAIVVTILLVPQSLAYALLAGLPPKVGIYASITPLLAYAVLGSSRQLNVGPTAVISLMTASTIAELPEELRVVGAAALALMVGLMLIGAGVMKAGFLMNFVSRPVVSAYITGAALLIVISQLRHIFGVDGGGRTAFAMVSNLSRQASETSLITIGVGAAALLAFYLARTQIAFQLIKAGVPSRRAKMWSRMAPIVIIGLFIVASWMAGLDQQGLSVVGVVPGGLPPFRIPYVETSLIQSLLIPAAVIAIVAFVDSTSTAQELAARRRGSINANRELFGLGAANIAAGLSAGYAVNGSMSRSAVNAAAGGETPLSAVIVAILMALTAMFLTPLLTHLPLAVLAALIIIACFSLLDFRSIWRTWIYSRLDGLTAVATFVAVLTLGVQYGVLVGVVLAMALHIRTTVNPHMPLVGRFPGTEHYRDATRFVVETNDQVKTLRIDESLYYANARTLEDRVAQIVAETPSLTDLIMMCTAVNRIDASALSSLETINNRLKASDIRLHFSDMQSRVRERLFRSSFLDRLTGQIFLSQHEAMETLRPEPDWSFLDDHIDIH